MWYPPRLSILLAAVVSVLRAMRVVPSLVPSGGSPFVPACLMFAAVCLDASPPSSHHLVLGCVPFPAACPRLVPLLASSSSSMSVPLPSHCFSPPAPPHRHDGRGDTTVPWRLPLLCLLAPSLAISSVAVRYRMATRV